MRKLWLALIAALALTLAACGADETAGQADTGDGAGEEAADNGGDAEDDEAEDDEAEGDEGGDDMGDDGGEEAGDAAAVRVESTDLGDALVDADGMTLYLFESDADGESTCYDDCADSWPPLLDEDPVAGEGVDEALLGTTERDDGSVQVTYGDSPLYHWAGDSEPGDVEGQGVGDVWWLVNPSGDPITEAVSEDGASEDSGGSGY